MRKKSEAEETSAAHVLTLRRSIKESSPLENGRGKRFHHAPCSRKVTASAMFATSASEPLHKPKTACLCLDTRDLYTQICAAPSCETKLAMSILDQPRSRKLTYFLVSSPHSADKKLTPIYVRQRAHIIQAAECGSGKD